MYKRNCPKCGEELTYSNLGNMNLAIKRNSVCIPCSKIGTKTKKNHKEFVKRTCKQCTTKFEVPWKYRKQRFHSKGCMYEWRKEKNWTTSICMGCGEDFKHRKNERHPRSGKERMFCTSECQNTSEYKKDKLREWGYSDKNHWYNKEVQDKVRKTKLDRYGDENYNNMEKQSETAMEKYGVPWTFWAGKKSNGIRISKGQRLLYEQTKENHPDALLEHWLPDMQKSVDIYIPSEKTIIEFYGRYWHCDPNKYNADYVHPSRHLTAAEIWQRDMDREQEFTDAGYQVVVEWEK